MFARLDRRRAVLADTVFGGGGEGSIEDTKTGLLAVPLVIRARGTEDRGIRDIVTRDIIVEDIVVNGGIAS